MAGGARVSAAQARRSSEAARRDARAFARDARPLRPAPRRRRILRPRAPERSEARRSTGRVRDGAEPRPSFKPGSRARTRQAMSLSTPQTSSPDPLQADLVGVSLCDQAGEACYIPIGHRVGADDLFGGGGLAPGPDPGGGRARALEAADGGAGRPQDRPRHEVRHAGLRPARRRRWRRSTTRC